MQTEELAYVIVTPYSMRKSRTGGIVGRLISRTGLDLVGGRMFAPGAELARRYADTIVTETDPRHRATQELIRDYVLKNFTGEKNGQGPRVLFLIFRGPDAVEKIHPTVGHIVHERTSGETIRDTYGDYITDDSGNVTYFEPGVLAAFDPKAVEKTGKPLSNSWLAESQANVRRRSAKLLGRKNQSPLFIRASMRCERFATCLAQLTRPRPRRDQFAENSARLSWSTLRMHRIRWRTRNAKWRSSKLTRIISNL